MPQRKPKSPLQRSVLESPPPAQMRSAQAFAAGLLLVCAVVAAVHWPALGARATFIDDYQYFFANPLVQHPSWQSAKAFLTEVTEPSTVRGYYQPLSMISLMLDVAMGATPENLTPFHATSLALHVLNTALVAIFLYQLFGSMPAALFTALLFGVHPLTVEPIPWIGERKTLLATFFALGALSCYLRFAPKSSWRMLITVLPLYILAVMSKPTALPLPLVFVVLDVWPLQRIRRPKPGADWRRPILEKIPLVLLMAGSAVITHISQAVTASVEDPGSKSLGRLAMIVCHNIVFYAMKIVWPADLSAHYPFPDPMTLAQPMVLAGVIGTALIVALLLWSARGKPVFTAGALVFFLLIFPTLGVVGFTIVIASDKYAYLPMIGVLMMAAWLIRLAWQGGAANASPSRRRAIAVVILLIIAVAASVRTRLYLAKWRETETLYAHMLALSPDSAHLHFALGHFEYEHGRPQQAEIEYREALRLKPDFVDARNNLGVVLSETGRLNDAIAEYQAGLAIHGDDPDLLSNLGDAYRAVGRMDEAEACYRRAMSAAPSAITAINNLGDLLSSKGQLDAARLLFEKALAIRPRRVDVLNNYGSVLSRMGERALARTQFEKAVALEPDNPAIHYNFGNLLMDEGDFSEAVARYQTADRLSPKNPRVLLRLARACAAAGRREDAMAACRRLLTISPGDAEGAALLRQLGG